MKRCRGTTLASSGNDIRAFKTKVITATLGRGEGQGGQAAAAAESGPGGGEMKVQGRFDSLDCFFDLIVAFL